MVKKEHWEHFYHEADIGIRGIGATMENAFEQAAIALMAVVAEPESIQPETSITIHCQAPNPELLFVEWLNNLIYEMATRYMLFSHFKVQITGDELHASVQGEKLDIGKHQPAVEIKGATLTELKVTQMDGAWLAQTVVDV